MQNVAGYLLYLIFKEPLGYAVAYTIAYVLGVCASFALNYIYVFRSEEPILSSLTRFFIVQVSVYLAAVSLIAAQIEWIGMPEWLAPLVAIAVAGPFAYLATRSVLLRSPSREQRDGPNRPAG